MGMGARGPMMGNRFPPYGMPGAYNNMAAMQAAARGPMAQHMGAGRAPAQQAPAPKRNLMKEALLAKLLCSHEVDGLAKRSSFLGHAIVPAGGKAMEATGGNRCIAER